MRRVTANILEDIQSVTEGFTSSQLYGANLLGRALGHEIQANRGYVTGVMVAAVPAMLQFNATQQCIVRAGVSDILRGA